MITWILPLLDKNSWARSDRAPQQASPCQFPHLEKELEMVPCPLWGGVGEGGLHVTRRPRTQPCKHQQQLGGHSLWAGLCSQPGPCFPSLILATASRWRRWYLTHEDPRAQGGNRCPHWCQGSNPSVPALEPEPLHHLSPPSLQSPKGAKCPEESKKR